MSEFNKACVNFVEDKGLYGKYGYFSDDIDRLRYYVTNRVIRSWGRLSRFSSNCESYPFVREENDSHYKFFYYDPALYSSMPVTSGRMATYRELSRWLAQGNGEGIHDEFAKSHCSCFTEMRYMPDDGNRSVQDILVRKWGDDEWHIPTETYLGLDS